MFDIICGRSFDNISCYRPQTKFRARSYFFRCSSVHRGESLYDITSCVAPWSHVPFGGSAYRGGDLLPGGQHPVGFASRESSSRGVCLQPPPPIRKVGGMHPTWNAFLLGTDFRRLKVWSSTTRMDSWKYWFHFSVKNLSKFDMYLRKDY